MVKRSMSPGPRDERGVLAARILGAARDAFADHGWAGTTIRAIARAADVDPALVYHYFGSKEGLLDAATTPPQQWVDGLAATWSAPVEDLGAAMVTLFLTSWVDEDVGPTLRAILQIAAHEPATRDKLRMFIEGGLVGVSRLGGDERDRLRRSALVASQMIGFAMMRYIWKIEPLASMTEDEVISAIGPNLQRYLEGDLSGPR